LDLSSESGGQVLQFKKSKLCAMGSALLLFWVSLAPSCRNPQAALQPTMYLYVALLFYILFVMPRPLSFLGYNISTP
jgi:hypothetical protein